MGWVRHDALTIELLKKRLAGHITAARQDAERIASRDLDIESLRKRVVEIGKVARAEQVAAARNLSRIGVLEAELAASGERVTELQGYLRRFMPDLDQWNDLDARVQKSLDAYLMVCRRADGLERQAKRWPTLHGNLVTQGALDTIIEQRDGNAKRVDELEYELEAQVATSVAFREQRDAAFERIRLPDARLKARVAELEGKHQVAPMAVACGLKPDATLDELYSRMSQLNSSWVRVAELRLKLEEIANETKQHEDQ